jgi:CDGSH-type Zn-finger protein/truncated hemoglobin YjbI
MKSELTALLARARRLQELHMSEPEDGGGREELRAAGERLERSVARPLVAAGASASAGAETTDIEPREAPAGDLLWQLTLDATRLRLRPDHPPELQEAVAALQELACRTNRDGRLAELERIQLDLPAQVRCQRDGPYLVTNARRLTNWLGEGLPTQPQMALCRCGESALKPLCDGRHAEVGFTDAKDPARIPDRRDAYAGQQVTILDNRGICQHAGFCSDRLATVFRVGEEPFVAPSGGRMDEIIRAVRDCPSGALSYAIDGHEARAQVDHGGTRQPAIEVSKDGPYRITGGLALTDGDGEPEARGEGASLEHYALCRCGHSQNKPFCSGMHWNVEFRDPVADPDHEPTVFEWAGGLPALTRMTRLFYERYVPEDPLLAPLFADMSVDHPERVARWLGEVFCGPKEYSERHGGYSRMVTRHMGKALSEEQRARWVELMLRCATEAGLPGDPEWRSAFSSYLEWGSRLALENSQPGAHPPPQMPMPRWDWSTAAGPPGSRVSAFAPPGDEEERPPVLPAPGEPLSFDSHIKQLFRRRDRQSMKLAFDLWSYDDVVANADAILERIKAGSMPCDGAWPHERVAALEAWVEAGCPR